MKSLFAKSLILMAAAEAVASTAGGAVPTSTTADAQPATKTRAPKNPDNLLDIINGRLPLPLVFMIRFDTLGAASNADNAKKFGTSVGKVFDIKKGRNFGYVDKDYKPSAEEMAAAKAWCETGKTAKSQKTLGEVGGNPTAILEALGKMTVATAEEVAKRNWQVRTVGEKATGTAPAAPAAAATGQTAAAEKPAGAKLF